MLDEGECAKRAECVHVLGLIRLLLTGDSVFGGSGLFRFGLDFAYRLGVRCFLLVGFGLAAGAGRVCFVRAGRYSRSRRGHVVLAFLAASKLVGLERIRFPCFAFGGAVCGRLSLPLRSRLGAVVFLDFYFDNLRGLGGVERHRLVLRFVLGVD